ncbi:Liver carboxylesterase [Orchesella cincta]|uniref:Carboxylic ester hydrolase n=1 Tax=Orchesella cincta TaxID=48709 RepID=A0A1D2MU62_ORCCI|nr:Liver carboxylesterase [Orchesella cincta]
MNKKPDFPEVGYVGSIETLPGIEPVATFKGVPYAQPPINDLRYQPPVPFEETEVRNATEFAEACLQWDLFRNQNVTGSEDCLHLNVYVLREVLSRPRDSSLVPVMVFFHGVGFVACQSDTYNPEYLVQKGVAVVTVQYRLGSLGFLSSGDKLQPGNMGMLDQVEALRWVKKNIRSFGGDPDRVMIFGESSGAVSVNLMLVSPLTKGLFTAAIIQSGSAIAPYAIQRSPMTHVQRLAANLGCLSGSTETLLKCIKTADPVEVVTKDATSAANTSERKSSRSHKKPPNSGPVVQLETVEGWPVFLQEDPEAALAEGHFHKVPVVIGVNKDESASAVLSNLLPRLINATESDSTYAERVFLRKVLRASGIVNNTEVAKASIKFEYFKNYNMSEILELKDEFITLHSDFSVVAPVYRTAMYLSQRTPVYFYTFEYEGELSFSEYLLQPSEPREPRMHSSASHNHNNHKRERQVDAEISELDEAENSTSITNISTGDTEPLLDDRRHVIHGEELLYLFRFRNPSTRAVVDVEDDEGMIVRETMCTLWTNVAKYGQPTPVDVERNSLPLDEWKMFSTVAPYTYKITSKTTLLTAYRHRKMLFWTSFIPTIQSLELCS